MFDKNMSITIDYLNARQWTKQQIADMKPSRYTGKGPDHNEIYLGSSFKEAGNCVNCNGAEIMPDIEGGFVRISTYKESGYPTAPYI